MSAQPRSLSTARAVLRVLSLLSEHPEGICAQEVARVLGKSPSTAYYLLNSLCQEGFAAHGPHPGSYLPSETWTAPEPEGAEPTERLPEADLSDAVMELYLRTGKRSYLAVPDAHGVTIHEVKGRQGIPRMQGVGPHILREAHSLALGKAFLAYASPATIEAYAEHTGLPAFTPTTITDPVLFSLELARVRRDGYAIDREEFCEGFCCVSAPILDGAGRLRALLALSSKAKGFEAEGADLVGALRDVAGIARGSFRPLASASA